MYTLEGLNKHFRKRRCIGKIENASKNIYNENIIIKTSNLIHPQNLLQFYENFNLDQFLQHNTIQYCCIEKGCNFHCEKSKESNFKAHVITKHLGLELKCYAC